MASTKEQRIAAISTLLFCFGFCGLLMLFSFTIPQQKPEEQGILINFGDSDQGSGEIEPMIADASQQEEVVQEQKTEPTVVPQESKSEVGDENVETQNFEEAAVIEKRKKEIEKKQKDEEVKKQQELENQRLAEVERQRQVEIENQKRLAEEQRKQRQQDSIRNRTKDAFNAGRNANGGNTSEGNTGGDGNQGDINGDVNSKNRTGGGTGGDGIDFSLKGRSFGSVPPKPVYLSKSEGKVVVEIFVDRNGNVTEARPGVQGTTTPDKALHQAAKDAALKAKFDSNPNAPAVQKGTITYHFILQ